MGSIIAFAYTTPDSVRTTKKMRAKFGIVYEFCRIHVAQTCRLAYTMLD